jgi:hypothetical protein
VGNAWRTWFLLGLNACMYLADLCELRWEHIKGDKLTCRREKTNIARCAVLWPETLAALVELRHKGPYVFTSAHSTKYSSNGRYKDFPEIREKAGLPDTTAPTTAIKSYIQSGYDGGAWNGTPTSTTGVISSSALPANQGYAIVLPTRPMVLLPASRPTPSS